MAWLLSRLALIITCIGLTLMAPSAFAHPRTVIPLDTGWRFARGDLASAQTVGLDDRAWQPVTLPHTFNAAGEGADKATYSRGASWYRRNIRLANANDGQHTFIEFDGAALVTDIWVNGRSVGRHAGGYARFRFDLTPFLHRGNNLLAVRVDNSKDPAVAPLGGDFTQFGGIYRPVRLVRTAALHFDMLDYGSSGVYLTPSDVSQQGAGLTVKALVANDSGRTASFVVTVHVKDAKGKKVVSLQQRVVVGAGMVLPVSLRGAVAAPHLWNGVDDPYLYTAQVQLSSSQGGASHDAVAIPFGFRDIKLDPDQGLLLNGKRYDVHGPNVHLSMRPGKAVAVSTADIAEDFKLFEEMGATGLRLAHYQHEQETYDLADRKGLLIWTEAPFVSEISGTDDFLTNGEQQLKELIRQNYNHASVFVWGLGNEIYKVDGESAKVLEAMQTLAHAEDAGRPTTYANCCGPIDGPQASHTDVVASNVYFGWYSGEFSDLGPWLDQNHAKRPLVAQAVSEYGAGASARQQAQNPRRPEPNGHWHPEQYQTAYHEAAWRQLRDRPYLWAKFFWVGFDFPSVGRDEGDTPGFNDKGLITYDRKTRKDAYFWYQANWSKTPMVYLTSRRDTHRTEADMDVKVYSNASSATLTINGKTLAPVPVVDHVATWSIRLRQGRNRLRVTANGASDHADFYLNGQDTTGGRTTVLDGPPSEAAGH